MIIDDHQLALGCSPKIALDHLNVIVSLLVQFAIESFDFRKMFAAAMTSLICTLVLSFLCVQRYIY